MATAVKVIQVTLVCACLLGFTAAMGRKHGKKRGRCLEWNEMSADSLTRAPCHPRPCKEKWITDFAMARTIGACENHWSCCSEDDQCVTSVLNCTIQNTNSTDLAPHCDYHGISVVAHNCDITVNISNFDNNRTTSITLAIEYRYNCSEQHHCHSTCKSYGLMKSQGKKKGPNDRDSRSNRTDEDESMDYVLKDQAGRYCSVGDEDTFKQTTSLQVLFPKPQLTLSGCSNGICNESDDRILQASMNCNITMTCSLGLDSEEVENTWVYFRFRQANTSRIITANCEPRKNQRSANYNWEIYRGEDFDCKLEIPYTGADDIGDYECGILDVSNVNNVNSVARSEARNFVVFDDPTMIIDGKDPRGSNFPIPMIAGSASGSVVAISIGLLLVIVVIKLVQRRVRGRQEHQEGELQGELGANDQDQRQLLREDRVELQDYGGIGEQGHPVGEQEHPVGEQGHPVGEQEHPVGQGDGGGHVHGPPAAQGEVHVGGGMAAQVPELIGSGDSAERSDVVYLSFEHVERPPDQVDHGVDDQSQTLGDCTIL